MKMDYDDFTVILPTLNEEKTIGRLVRELMRSYKNIHILVVDDGSTDNTKDEVYEGLRKSHNVRFMDRTATHSEKGLTASIVDGIMNSNTKFAIVMDADMQHPPEIVGGVAKALWAGSDIAVASRVKVEGWELHRKIISKTLITVGYVILFLRGRERCRDVFSGFFGVRKKLFEETYLGNKRRFVSGGYKVLFDLLKCLKRRQVKVAEVPYSFGVRKYGTSKAGIRQGMYLFRSFFS